jgi:hypothetical protein
MKCLGLHNKHMAEVHPEHMLTGHKEEEETQHLSKYEYKRFGRAAVSSYVAVSLIFLVPQGDATDLDISKSMGNSSVYMPKSSMNCNQTVLLK